jgi:pimeloyl-ACP methyl ester carboxylesterase
MDNTTQPASSFAAQIAALINHDAIGRLGSITTSALVIACEDDIVIKPALSHRLHEALPGSAWQLLPGGHATFLENPVLWNATVLEFLDAHRAHPRPVGGSGPP